MTDKKRINIAIQLELHKKLRVKAIEDDTTVTDYVIQAITEKLERDKTDQEE